MNNQKGVFIIGFFATGVISVAYFSAPLFSVQYDENPAATTVSSGDEKATTTPDATEEKDVFVATHVETPKPVRGIYMTQCAAATPSFRTHIKSLIRDTEVNSVIIDIKDFSGTLAFRSEHPLLMENGGGGCRVAGLAEFIEELHQDGVYVIGRVTVFQDPFYTSAYPEYAVRKKSETSTVWTDHKGLSFVDVGARPFWEYIVAISEESYRLGVDEINFDYIRYPSDGNMKDVHYVHSDGNNKAHELEKFFKYLSEELSDTGAVLSADLFGMTTTNTDDLNIGQQIERAFPYFDYIAPMVYPSHYPKGFNGYTNVNAYPYEIVKFSMDNAVRRARASTTPVNSFVHTRIGTSTPVLYEKPVYEAGKLRPWLQDFDYPVDYTSGMVRTQIDATYDAGLDSWMLWDPANRYTRSALEPAE